MVEEQLISVLTEKDIVAMLTTSNSYINVNESVIECSFQCLEVVNATFVGVGKRVPIACLSSITKKGVKQTVGRSMSQIRAWEIPARVTSMRPSTHNKCQEP